LKVVPAPFGPISQQLSGLELKTDAVAAPTPPKDLARLLTLRRLMRPSPLLREGLG
jgi:hypothetical protein